MPAQILGWFTTDHVWMLIGFGGQALFTSRFLVQWFKSEVEGRSVIPVAFWYFSILGGTISLAYAIHIESAPYITGQAGRLVVYGRNLYLIFRERALLRQAAAGGGAIG